MSALDTIPARELRLELCCAGSFNSVKDGTIHSKTCPYTILAQAVQGSYEISCDDRRHEVLREGDAFLTGANLPLRITHHGNPDCGYRMRARWVHLHITLFGLVDVTSLLDLPLRVSKRQCEPFGEIIEELLKLPSSQSKPLCDVARQQELAFRTLGLLCELAPMRSESLSILQQTNRFCPVLNYMEAHLSKKLTVAELAKHACMSVPHFHAFFRQFMSRSPMKHLKYLRLSKACSLLASGDSTLQSIAEQTGFCNEFHLSREFRRVFGKPPGAWRRDYDQTLV